MFWLGFAIYWIGWLTMFRFAYLSGLDEIQRELAQNRNFRREDDIRTGQYFVPVVVSTFWPLVVAGYAIRFAMFPRGIKTKFDREQELEKKQADDKVKLAEAEKVLRAAGAWDRDTEALLGDMKALEADARRVWDPRPRR